MAAKKKRVTRKELLKSPDEFLTFSNKAWDWAKQRPKTVVGIGAGFVALLLIVVLFQVVTAGRRNSAQHLFNQGYYSFEASKQQNDAKRRKASKMFFMTLVADYESEPQAGVGMLFLAQIARADNKPLEAIKWLERFLARDDTGDAFKGPARLALASAYEAAGKLDRAKGIYSRLKARPYQAMGLMRRARILEREGKLSEAVKLYREVADKFPKFMLRDFARHKASTLSIKLKRKPSS